MGGLQLHFIGQSFKEMLFEPASVGAEDFRLKYKNMLKGPILNLNLSSARAYIS